MFVVRVFRLFGVFAAVCCVCDRVFGCLCVVGLLVGWVVWLFVCCVLFGVGCLCYRFCLCVCVCDWLFACVIVCVCVRACVWCVGSCVYCVCSVCVYCLFVDW